MKSVRTNIESRCPACLKRLDAATHMGQATPREGDLSVCAYCTTICTFNADLTLRPMRQDEFDALPVAQQLKIELYRNAAIRARNRLAPVQRKG